MSKVAKTLMDNLKQVLGVVVSTIVIVAAMGGYVGTFASTEDLETLKTQHTVDMERIEGKIDTNETQRQVDQLQALSESYTDKLMEASLQPSSSNKSILINHYKQKKGDVEVKLRTFR